MKAAGRSGHDFREKAECVRILLVRPRPATWTNNLPPRMFRKSDYLGRSLDLALLGVLSVAVGLHLVAHVTLVIGLLRRDPWWRGAIALVVPPLAPFWGYEARLRGRVTLWVVTLVVYLVTVTAAAL